MGAAISLVAAVAVPLGGGMAMGALTKDEIKGWYAGLKKPAWNPPNWLFAPAWSVFYTSMGIASWVTMRKGVNRTTPLVLYAVQLALNLGWTPLMFKAHKIDVALADSTAMLGLAAAATVSMTKSTNRPGTILPLMVPYLCWVTFATALTGELLRLNPTERLDYEKLRRKAHDTKAAAKTAVKEGAKKAKEDINTVAQATKETTQQATTKAKETAKKAAAEVSAAAEQVAKKTGEVASEVARKAREDAHELKQVVKEAVKGDGAADEAAKPLLS